MLSNVRVTMKSVHYGSPCLSHVTNTKIHSVCRKDIPLPLVQHTLVSHTHTHTRTQITAGFCQTSAPNTCRVSPNKCKLGTKYLKSLSFMGTKYLQFCQTWAPNTWRVCHSWAPNTCSFAKPGHQIPEEFCQTWAPNTFRVCHSWAPNTCRVLSNLGTKYLQSFVKPGHQIPSEFVIHGHQTPAEFCHSFVKPGHQIPAELCQTWAPNTCRVMLNLGTKYLQSYVKPGHQIPAELC